MYLNLRIEMHNFFDKAQNLIIVIFLNNYKRVKYIFDINLLLSLYLIEK